MRQKKKYFIPFWFLLSFIFHSVNAQNLEHYFKSKGVESVARLAHPTNNFQTGSYKIYDNFILVDIKYVNYTTRLKIYNSGDFLTDIQVIEDNDMVSPFLAIELIKEIYINTVREERVGKNIILRLEDVLNKAISDMSGSELACVILTLESLGSSFEKEEYNDNNSQREGFEAAFSENDQPNDGFAAAFSEHEQAYDHPKNGTEINISDGQKKLSNLRRLVRNYYQYLEDENWGDLEKMFAPILTRFYGEYNYSKFKVLSAAKDYKSKFNIISTEYNVRWETFKVIKKGENYIVSFIMDYELIKRNSKKRFFVLNIFMEFDENRKIRSLHENKL